MRHQYLVIHFYYYVRVLSIYTHTQLTQLINIIMYGRILNAMFDMYQASDEHWIPSFLISEDTEYQYILDFRR